MSEYSITLQQVYDTIPYLEKMNDDTIGPNHQIVSKEDIDRFFDVDDNSLAEEVEEEKMVISSATKE